MAQGSGEAASGGWGIVSNAHVGRVDRCDGGLKPILRREEFKMNEDDKDDLKVDDTPKAPMPKEIGGPKGPEPTRYGDWEVKGRCSDF